MPLKLNNNMQEIYNWLTDNKKELMNKFIYNMIPNRRDAEDFYQDLYIIMSTKKEDKLLEILNRSTEKNNEMMRYLYIIIRNNLQSKNSRYYYTYRKPVGSEFNEQTNQTLSYDNTIKFELLQEIEDDYQKLLKKIKRHFDLQLIDNPKSFYEKQLFEMYFEKDNTYRGLGKMLDIPATSIYNTIKKGKLKIEKKFKKDIENINQKLIYYYDADCN